MTQFWAKNVLLWTKLVALKSAYYKLKSATILELKVRERYKMVQNYSYRADILFAFFVLVWTAHALLLSLFGK